MNKYKYLYIIVFSIFLVGCSNEPMIRLSEENQAILESKRQASIEEAKKRENELASIENEASVNESTESSSQEEATSSVASEESVEDEALTIIDPSTWTQAADGTVWELSHFVPYQINQIRQFSTSSSRLTTYVDFTNEGQTAWQVREINQSQPKTHLIELQTNQITQVSLTESIRPFMNYLSTLTTQGQNQKILLQAPVTTETAWTNADGSTASITAMYDAIKINGQSYANVVEVTSADEKRYYGENQGLLLVLTDADSIVLETLADNVQIVVPYTVWLPNEDTDATTLLTQKEVDINWQTNSTAGSIMTQFFRNQNWLNDSVSINSVSLMENTVTVDFTAGVVAAMNSHPTKEQGVIPAIVATMADLFSVENVVLTVNGNGLLPDVLPYPTGGSWQVDPSWMTQTN